MPFAQAQLAARKWCLRMPLVIACGFMTTAYGVADSRVLVVGVVVFRAAASSVVLPAYPRASLSAGHQGRAVVELRVSETGKVIWAHVLEAPDRAIGSTVQAAVMRWSFRPFIGIGRKDPFIAQSRLIFYFKAVDGKPVVIDAAAEALAVHAKTNHQTAAGRGR